MTRSRAGWRLAGFGSEGQETAIHSGAGVVRSIAIAMGQDASLDPAA